MLIIFYFITVFCEFLAPYGVDTRQRKYPHCPPQRIHFFDEESFHLRPFVYRYEAGKLNMETFQRTFTEDKFEKYPLYFFIRSDEYKLWNLFKTNIHLFGVREGEIFLFGTDIFGRDLFSRNLYATRISLSIGLAGVLISFVLGCILGGVSGYYGGRVDTIIQRVVEFLLALPKIPLWLALSAAIPADWSITKVYFTIVVILSLFGWCGLARVVRGKLLELREEDFAMASKISGSSERRVIIRHLLPNFMSYLIVHLTLAVPHMILGETALSFLGIGMRPPAVSWGVLMSEAQNVNSMVLYPWLLIPGFFVVVAILSFNFIGDGLRDAADPYK